MNVLLTSIGRRSYLVEYFKDALSGSGSVIAANMFADTAGMFAADIAIQTPPSQSEEYLPAILDICREYDIRILCSLHDLDTFVLSQHVESIQNENVIAVLPNAEWGRIALDKYECSCVLESNGISVPQSVLSVDDALAAVESGRMHFPLIVKARFGFGSLGMERCTASNQLVPAFERAKQSVLSSPTIRFIDAPSDQLVVIQQFLQGREFCVGVLNDLKGNYRSHFVCEVHSMRAGESDMATSFETSIADELAVTLGKLTTHKGVWGIDCLQDQGKLQVIDVNPRFTGDYPFHHLAGADIPRAIVSWASGHQPDERWLKSTAGVRGYKDLVPRRIPVSEN